VIADLQREYLKQIWRAFGTRCSFRHFSGGTHVGVALTKGDKRFKDASWREQPYYDLLKQTYLLGSRQLHEFVDRAQVTTRRDFSFGSMPVSLSTR
jgi:poly[(R)-3-hydroxyalkanoate] polymerase subunit PhaC